MKIRISRPMTFCEWDSTRAICFGNIFGRLDRLELLTLKSLSPNCVKDTRNYRDNSRSVKIVTRSWHFQDFTRSHQRLCNSHFGQKKRNALGKIQNRNLFSSAVRNLGRKLGAKKITKKWRRRRQLQIVQKYFRFKFLSTSSIATKSQVTEKSIRVRLNPSITVGRL